MNTLQPFVVLFYLSSYHIQAGRVLNDIINVLASNPRTRTLFLRTVSSQRNVQRLQRLRRIQQQQLLQQRLQQQQQQQRYVYALEQPEPSLVNPATFNNGVTVGSPIGAPPVPAGATTTTGTTATTTGAPVGAPVGTPEGPIQAKPASGGVALDINGDMKQNIPYKFVSFDGNHEDYQDQVAHDMLFKKKRTIIKELKSLFRVILDDNPNTHRQQHHRRRFHTPLLKSHRVRGNVAGSSKVAGNTTLVFQGAKRGKISPSPVRQKVKGNKRVVLYRKLINDLNDLITLEISRNNKTNTFEGVEELAPSNLRRTLPKTSDDEAVTE